MAASSGKKSSRSKKSRSSSARSSKSSKSSLWRQIKTIGISIIVVYWLASCFTFGVSDFEIFDEGHWVTAKARAEKVAAFTAEHPEAFIMDVWGFGDRTKINPVIAGADSGVSGALIRMKSRKPLLRRRKNSAKPQNRGRRPLPFMAGISPTWIFPPILREAAVLS